MGASALTFFWSLLRIQGIVFRLDDGFGFGLGRGVSSLLDAVFALLLYDGSIIPRSGVGGQRNKNRGF